MENGGHFVPDDEVESRFNLGYKYLNEYWNYFDEVHLFNTSYFNKKPKYILSIKEGNINELYEVPEFLKLLLPDLPFKK